MATKIAGTILAPALFYTRHSLLIAILPCELTLLHIFYFEDEVVVTIILGILLIQLIKKLVQTRNYHTHGDSKDKYPEMITVVHEMYETKLLLQEVLIYYIYQELDMKNKSKKF